MHAARACTAAWEAEFQRMREADYGAFGLEPGVDSEAVYMAAKNRALLLEWADRMHSKYGGKAAIEQFEAMFRRRSET